MVSKVTVNTNSLNVPWSLGTTYRIALDADLVKEPSNNKKGNPAVNNLVTFTTNATTPTLSSSVPTNGAFDVTNNTSIVLTFSRNVEAGTGNIRLYQADPAVDTLIYTYNMSDPAFVTISTNTITLKTTGFLTADTPYYLIFDSNAVRDLDNFNYAGSRTAKTVTANGNATTNSSVTKWDDIDSIIFDGVGDYLSVPSSVDFGYGTGSFLIEAWIRPTTASQTSVIVDHRPTATEGLYPTLRLQSGVLQYYTNSAVRITGSTITANTWTFVQVARFAGTTRLYVNGVQVGSDYTDSNNYPTAAVKIGVNGVDLSAGFTGYMSDIRIAKAPISLQGMPTRSRVNDEYTVLYVQGGVGDVNSTIFFDTQEESLGFPSLSASLTGAFTPTFSIRYTATSVTVMSVSVTVTCANIRLRRATITMNSVNTFTMSARVDYAVIQTFNNIFTQSVSGDRIRFGNSIPNLSSTFGLGYPWLSVGSQTSAQNAGYITQAIIDSFPSGTKWDFTDKENPETWTYNNYIIKTTPGATVIKNGVTYLDAGKIQVYNTSNVLQYTIENPNPDLPNESEYFGEYIVVDNAESYLTVMRYTKAYLYNLSTGNLVDDFSAPNFSTQAEACSAYTDGTRIIVGKGGRAYVYAISNGSLLHSVTADNLDTGFQNNTFNARINSNYFIISNTVNSNKQTSLYDTSTGTYIQGFTENNYTGSQLAVLSDYAMTTDGKYLRIGYDGSDHQIYVRPPLI